MNTVWCLATLAALLAAPCLQRALAFEDVLETPAIITPLAERSPLVGITRAGERLVTVGQRGHILLSRDGGVSWRQSSVPVSSDLNAVQFVDDKKGWAVGHDGVVLSTEDGGETWKVVLDGRTVGPLLVEYYEKLALEPERREAFLKEAKLFEEQGPDKPFMDVYFESTTEGFVIGTFNLILKTSDGGRTWVPWLDRTENPRILNFHAIREVEGDVYIAGEQGTVLKLDRSSQRFVKLQTPYEGSYFGVVGKPGYVVVFGMRGHVYVSSDRGNHWKKLETNLEIGITGGMLADDGRIVLVSQTGHVLVSDGNLERLEALALDERAPAAGIAQSQDAMVTVGFQGVSRVPWVR
ncbi:MAG TPA: YCF48-related protein [Gammaproteobacteria bacterium]|nr:YCF48-related protein [Gammaproteobacteria bacterium]